MALRISSRGLRIGKYTKPAILGHRGFSTSYDRFVTRIIHEPYYQKYKRYFYLATGVGLVVLPISVCRVFKPDYYEQKILSLNPKNKVERDEDGRIINIYRCDKKGLKHGKEVGYSSHSLSTKKDRECHYIHGIKHGADIHWFGSHKHVNWYYKGEKL